MKEPSTVGSSRKNKGVVQGLQLVSSAAKRVWEELYVCKKPVSQFFLYIENTRRVPFDIKFTRQGFENSC